MLGSARSAPTQGALTSFFRPMQAAAPQALLPLTKEDVTLINETVQREFSFNLSKNTFLGMDAGVKKFGQTLGESGIGNKSISLRNRDEFKGLILALKKTIFNNLQGLTSSKEPLTKFFGYKKNEGSKESFDSFANSLGNTLLSTLEMYSNPSSKLPGKNPIEVKYFILDALNKEIKIASKFFGISDELLAKDFNWDFNSFHPVRNHKLQNSQSSTPVTPVAISSQRVPNNSNPSVYSSPVGREVVAVVRVRPLDSGSNLVSIASSSAAGVAVQQFRSPSKSEIRLSIDPSKPLTPVRLSALSSPPKRRRSLISGGDQDREDNKKASR